MALSRLALQAKKKKSMYVRDWLEKLHDFLRFNDREVLRGSGKVSHKKAKMHAEREFEKFDTKRGAVEDAQPSEFDKLLEDSRRVQTQLPHGVPKDNSRKRREKREGDET